MRIITKEDKKFVKNIMKKHIEEKQRFDERKNMKNLINIFVKSNDGESGKDFYLFAGTDTKAIISELDNCINIEGVHFTSAYDCTGRYFSNAVKVHKMKNRTLVTQQWYYDV